MSLTSALYAGVSGLNAQGSVLGIIGDNISNSSTTGFKSGSSVFESLVTGSGSSGGGAGVISGTRLNVDQQGLIQNTGVSTDIAISGQGFFVVTDQPEGGEAFYTRAGSFRRNELGYFVNSAGYTLQAWPLDNDERLPGAEGNTNTIPQQRLDSLNSVNTRDISGLAFATTSISLGINLDASEALVGGASGTLTAVSANNADVAPSALITPNTGTIEVGDELRVTSGTNPAVDFAYGGLVVGNDIQNANIFGVGLPADKFTDVGTSATQIADGDTFTIQAASVIASDTTTTATFTFENDGTPNTAAGEFNSLATLADAINAVTGLNAKVAGEGVGVSRLYVSSEDANEAVTFANGTNAGNATLDNADALYQSLGLANIAAGTARWNTLDGLAELVNGDDFITATISNSSIKIATKDPESNITFASTTLGTGNLNTEFGITATAIDKVYDVVNDKTMASGDISTDFSRNVRIFDSQGEGHDIRVSFAKSAQNNWLVEVFAANPDELASGEGYQSGLLASGKIVFNGDGSLNSVSNALQNPISIKWANQTSDSTISLNLGTAGALAGTAGATEFGQTDGLSQYAGDYSVQFSEQNGASAGLLSSVEIDDEGFIIANFSNGEARKIYKIPLASFPNPNGLFSQSGNVFSSSEGSGDFSLLEAGKSGVGALSVSALEQANTELAEELTQLIVAQRAYQSNTKIITTADQLLEELNRL